VSPYPPGLYFEGDYSWLTLKITNFGETPAEIVDIVVHWIEELPEVPNVKREEGEEESFFGAFLVKSDWIIHNMRSRSFSNIRKIWDREIDIFVYGHVDYIDMFKKRHRFGFARYLGYEPSDKRENYRTEQEFQERNNLWFVSKS